MARPQHARLGARRPTALLLALIGLGCAGSRQQPGGSPATEAPIHAVVREAAHPLTGVTDDYDPLLALIADARVVVLGESTHGTREYYQERARITRRLIAERGFSAIALEADWPSTYRVNQYVRGVGADRTPAEALAGYDRFPTWLWRNTEMRELLGWLRAHNDSRPSEERVGVYGIDVYDLFGAADAAIASLATTDPAAAARARRAYACFEPYRPDPERYGAGAVASPCRAAAEEVLADVDRLSHRVAARGAVAEEVLSAVRSAQVVASAEAFYRTMFTGGESLWNLRDRGMAEGVRTIERHLASSGVPPKIVIWAHNTHAGDARQTEAADSGEINLGQLLREQYDDEVVLVGFFTYTGTVLAAQAWGGTARVSPVPPALPRSVGAVFRNSGVRRFLLPLRGNDRTRAALSEPLLQRAIGAVYPLGNERQYYFEARLARQFDAAVFVDSTKAVTPLLANEAGR